MAYTPVRIYAGTPASGEQVSIVGAITGSRIIKQIVMCNTGSSASLVQLSVVPSGSTAIASRIFNQTIALGETVVLDLSHVMVAGDSIWAAQSGTSVVVHISGVSF